MDTVSLYYFTEVAKDLHITHTASRLFISQQTLSNHILRLENQLGVTLFHRKPTLSLTYAGEQVLSFAEALNRENQNLKELLAEINNEDRGRVLFGASTLRMATLLPDILPIFSSRYPNVEVQIFDKHSRQLEDLVLNGTIDMAITVPAEKNPKLSKTPLMEDEIFLCASDSLLRKYYGDETGDIITRSQNGADLRDFSRLPFCLLENRVGRNLRIFFEEIGFSPKVYTTSAFFQISNSICFTGMAASFATRTSLHNFRGMIPEDIRIFPLHHGGSPIFQQTAIIRHRDRRFCHYNQYFFDLILDYFCRLKALPTDQLAAQGLKPVYADLRREAESAGEARRELFSPAAFPELPGRQHPLSLNN